MEEELQNMSEATPTRPFQPQLAAKAVNRTENKCQLHLTSTAHDIIDKQ